MKEKEEPDKRPRKKRRKRGGKKTKKQENKIKMQNIKIGHMNIRGLKSKIKDVAAIAEEEDYDVMVFTETKLKNKESRKIPGYKQKSLNRDTDAGGVIIYTKKDIKTKVVKKNKECETLWIKLSEKEEDTDCIVIGGIYSPCESSTTKNKISNFVSELDKDIKEIKENVTEKILMVGDMNAHVGCDDQGIKGNNQHVGVNGEEYRKLFKNNKMTLMNNTNVCKGKWTRIQGDSKSILDLTVATEALKDKITSMEIDEDGKLNIESKRAATDHKMTTLIIRDWVEKRKEKWRTLVTYDKNRWGEYSQDTDYNIRKLKRTEEITYEKMVAVVRKTSNKIRKKRKVPVNKQKKLFGYNEEIKKAIKERRIACQEWKKEKEPVRKEEKRKIYQRKRELAISLMEQTEAKEIEKLIKRNGKEELNFWRTIKQIKKKTSTKEEAIEDENGEITKNPRTIMKIKSEYYENLYKKNLSAEETERENEYLRFRRSIQ